MIKSVKRSLVLLFLVSAVYTGFLGGQTLAGKGRPWRSTGSLSRLLSANAAERGGAIGDMGLTSAQDNGANVPPEDVFETVLEHVEHEYIERDRATDARLSNGALAQMFASLDDLHTNYLEPSLRQARQDALLGRFHGIGAALGVTKSRKLDVDYRHLSVIDVMPGSPAEKAGLRSGDRITEIDGHWIIAYWLKVDTNRQLVGDIGRLAKEKDEAVRRQEAEKTVQKFQKGYNLTKAMPMLVTGEGKTLSLTVERPGQAMPLKAELTTALTEIDPVTYRTVGGKVGHLRVRQFNPRATQAFEKTLGDIHGGGLKGLIVDLRGNPGGVKADQRLGVDGYESARKLVGLLTRGGTVATIERRPNRPEPLTVAPDSRRINIPMVVLVDHGTANLSEFVAAALRDAGRAKIVGMHTFGDPILPLFAVFKTGAGAIISHARLLTASGASLGKGIEPDIAVSRSANGDAILERALTALE